MSQISVRRSEINSIKIVPIINAYCAAAYTDSFERGLKLVRADGTAISWRPWDANTSFLFGIGAN